MGLIKEKNRLLKYQIIHSIFGSLCDLILGGIPSVITNILGIIRNVLVYKNKFNIFMMHTLILISFITIISFNRIGIIGYIPLIYFVFFTIFIKTHDNYLFKIIFILSMFLWIIYDLSIQAYFPALFDLFTIIASVYSLVKIKNI